MIAPTTRTRSLAVAGVVVLVVAVALSAWVYHRLGEPQYGGVATIDQTLSRSTDEPAPEITPASPVSQSFVARENDLTAVRIFMGTYARANTAKIEFTLRDASGKVVATVQRDSRLIVDNTYQEFAFPAIADSEGRKYTAALKSPDGRRGNTVTVWISDCNCYAEGVPSIANVELPDKDLVMRVEYHHTGVVTWRELLDRLSQYKPWIFQGAGLVMVAFLGAGFALAALGVLVMAVMRSRPDEDQDADRTPVVWVVAAAVVALAFVLITGAYEGI